MKRHLENHSCSKTIFFDVEKKGKENNSLIYYVDENKVHKFFKIIRKTDENNFVCNPQGKFKYKNDIVRDINWEKVGVFKVGPYSNEEVNVQRKDIHGKILKVKNFFITCPNNVLQEK